MPNPPTTRLPEPPPEFFTTNRQLAPPPSSALFAATTTTTAAAIAPSYDELCLQLKHAQQRLEFMTSLFLLMTAVLIVAKLIVQ